MQYMQINIQMQCKQIFHMGKVQCKAAACIVSRIPQRRFFPAHILMSRKLQAAVVKI